MQFKDGDLVRNVFNRDWGVGVIHTMITARSAWVDWPLHPTNPGSTSLETTKNLEKVEE